ncbi:MAG: PilZ domain-containing protein, partial [Spirochaetaceae bacterium]
YLLLENEWMFYCCAQKLIKADEAPSDAIAALRLRLGFDQSRERAPASTVHHPEASTGFVRRVKGEHPVRGRVMSHETHAFRVVIPPDEHFRIGSEVDVFYQSHAGIFQVHTTVVNREDNVLHLRHSESLTRYQKRTYFRRRMHLPVLVRRAYTEEAAVETVLEDLGGGGASMRNPPELPLAAGDRVELRFVGKDTERLQVVGEVVRTSRNGGIAHLRFTSIREPVRDKIFQAIFAPQSR